jgi:DNA primase
MLFRRHQYAAIGRHEQLTIVTVPPRVDALGDPWREMPNEPPRVAPSHAKKPD